MITLQDYWASQAACMPQVYKGVLNKTRAVAVKTFAHMASKAEVIRFDAVSLCEGSLLCIIASLEECQGNAGR